MLPRFGVRISMLTRLCLLSCGPKLPQKTSYLWKLVSISIENSLPKASQSPWFVRCRNIATKSFGFSGMRWDILLAAAKRRHVEDLDLSSRPIRAGAIKSHLTFAINVMAFSCRFTSCSWLGKQRSLDRFLLATEDMIAECMEHFRSKGS